MEIGHFIQIVMEQNYLHKLGWFFEPRTWWLRHLLFWLYRYSDVLLGEIGMVDPTGISGKQFFALHLMPDLILVYAHLLNAELGGSHGVAPPGCGTRLALHRPLWHAPAPPALATAPP